MDLNHARLPIPPYPHALRSATKYILTQDWRFVKHFFEKIIKK